MTFHDKKYVAKNLVINVLGVLCMPLFLRWARHYSLPHLSKGKRRPRKMYFTTSDTISWHNFPCPITWCATLCFENQKNFLTGRNSLLANQKLSYQIVLRAYTKLVKMVKWHEKLCQERVSEVACIFVSCHFCPCARLHTRFKQKMDWTVAYDVLA